jgi:hypothetical protein
MAALDANGRIGRPLYGRENVLPAEVTCCRVLFQSQPSYDKTSLPNAISFNALPEAWADLGAKVSSAAVQRRQDQQGRPRESHRHARRVTVITDLSSA